jgi:LysR family hydrogen peroxide-inducible transcriptional activator
VAISEHHTFSKAADALGTVQSNISSRVARLEAELASELVERSTGRLTESGAVVVDRARRILAELAAIASDVSELNADIRGEVALGMIGTAGRWIVPLLLQALKSEYPHIRLRITEGTNSVIEPQLVSGQLDLAVLAWPIEAPELSETDLFSEDLVLIVEKTHPLGRHESVNFHDLAPFELLLPYPGTPLRREIDDASTAQGVTLRPLVELDGLRTIASLTFDGHGASILPATMLTPHLRDTFAGVPIEGIAQRRVCLARRRFGFPAAPVRAIGALLSDVVASATSAPAGIYLS